MAVLTIEEARAGIARVASQSQTERVRALAEDVRAAEEKRIGAVRSMGESIRQMDDLIARIRPTDSEWERILAEARAFRTDLFRTMQEQIPAEAWFWTEEWQAGEREVDAHIAAGKLTHFASDEEFDAALDELDAQSG